MRAITFGFLTGLTLVLMVETGTCAKPELKKVTRIENVSANMKGRKLIVRADGMALGAGLLGGGELQRHSADHQPNKDGLLEYDLCYVPPSKTPKDKLKPVKASLKESSVPADVKGVRVYAEYNQMDGLIPAPKQKKPKEKK